MPVTSNRTGSGEDKKWDNGTTGKATTPQKAKEYRKNPETGKVEEYKGVDYTATTPHWKKAEQMHNNTHDIDTTTTPEVKPVRARPRFSG